VAISEKRFEWLSIPAPEDNESFQQQAATNAFIAKTCPECGWVDGDKRFEEIAGIRGLSECWRCGSRWDISSEIRNFFMEESISLPAVRVSSVRNFKKFYKVSDENDDRLFDLNIQVVKQCLQKGFDTLLCLSNIHIDHLDHQIKTVMAVLKKMRGRALLADEVGMGKTIEAGIILKELLLRGIVKTVLILAPAGLTGQWRDELQSKFNETFSIFSGKNLEEDEHRLIMSYDTAKRRKILKTIRFDLIILDEADRLRTRKTQVAEFVKSLKSKYLLALTATPIHNSLNDLYALVDMIKPGKLGTYRGYRRTFVNKANPCKVVAGREETLKDILSDIMIRNRRDTCGFKVARRRVGICWIKASHQEMLLYDRVSKYVKEEFKKEFYHLTGNTVHMLSLIILQRELMSTPNAVHKTLSKIAKRKEYPEATRNRLEGFSKKAAEIQNPSKIAALKDIILRFRGNRFIVFTEFVASLESTAALISDMNLPVFCLHGNQSFVQREKAIKNFKNTSSSVLISTEAGGVGLNLQFCSHLVNFDLPWNPMKLEQRIGRIDRIGQENEVYIFNLVTEDTIEEYVVEILAKKLRMFEMVVGEMGSVLGHMEIGHSFEQMIRNVWLESSTREEEAEGFRDLAEKCAETRIKYDKNQANNHVVNQIGKSA